jgi:hypothetical protein
VVTLADNVDVTRRSLRSRERCRASIPSVLLIAGSHKPGILLAVNVISTIVAMATRLFCFKLESTSRSEIAGCHRDLRRAPYIARNGGFAPAISLQISNAVEERLQ